MTWHDQILAHLPLVPPQPELRKVMAEELISHRSLWDPFFRIPMAPQIPPPCLAGPNHPSRRTSHEPTQGLPGLR